jgi:CRISPR-associated protein (TIGR02710 family)
MTIDYSNQKLYIATLGTGASGKDIAHAIYFSLNQQNPDVAVFLVSQKTKTETFPLIEEILKTNKPNLVYNAEIFDEVNEFEVLHKSYLSIIKKYIKQGFAPKNIVVDYTSGTKPMSAAIVSAGIAAEVSLISYTYGQRGEGGRVKPGSEKITSLSTNLFTTEKKISQAVVLFNKTLFDAAADLLSSFKDIPHPDYENKINFLIQISKALSFWDKFNFISSFEILTKICKDKNLMNEANLLGIGINKLTQSVNFLKEKNVNDYKVLELISNAKRRANECKYDDAVARLYRTLEMIGQIEFEKEFKCNTSDVYIDNIPSDLQEEIKLKYFDSKDGKIKLPLFAAFDLLHKNKNKIGELFFNSLEDIKKVLHLRNNSILAHGNSPLSEKEFNESLQIIDSLTSEIKTKIKLPVFPVLK